MKRIVLIFLLVIIILYALVCGILFFFQERLIFFPEKLRSNYHFNFVTKFEELYFKMDDETQLHGLLFKANTSKGLVFYLHGNAGSLSSWGGVANTYLDRNYDVFILDYRGYGKSEGAINGRAQLFNDVQTVYNQIRKKYAEDSIIVLGYSIGSGPASWLASVNNPKMLILQAPFYSLTDLMRRLFPLIPTFILKYQFDNYKYVQACKMPIVVFHDKEDEVIPYESSLRLKEHFKSGDSLILTDGYGHNGLTFSDIYIKAMDEILEKK